MEKTISIKRAELMHRISNDIGQSQLPPCIVADCLRLILHDIDMLAQQQLEKDINAYKKAQEEQQASNVPELKEVDENVDG